MEIIPEQWKQYDEKYWVSDQGRVKRIYKNGTEHYLKPCLRDPHDIYSGYRVKMNNRYYTLNRLVWETFNGKVPDGYGVNGKLGKSIHDLYSLQLLSLEECQSIAGKRRRRKVVNLKTGEVYPSVKYAEKALFFSKGGVSSRCNGKVKDDTLQLEWYDETKQYKQDLKFIRK